MVTSSGGDEIAVSKYTVADGDQKRTVSTRLDDVVRAVVELGGTYPDVVQALQEAKNSGALASRFEVDALPEAGRSYDRIATGEEGEGEEGERVQTAAASPSPELSTKRGVGPSNADGHSAEKTGENAATDDDSDEKANTKKGFFAKILGR